MIAVCLAFHVIFLLSIYPFVHLPFCPSICLICLSATYVFYIVYLFVYSMYITTSPQGRIVVPIHKIN
jgi:hypothetical protein